MSTGRRKWLPRKEADERNREIVRKFHEHVAEGHRVGAVRMLSNEYNMTAYWIREVLKQAGAWDR